MRRLANESLTLTKPRRILHRRHGSRTRLCIRFLVDDNPHYGVTSDAIARYGPSILNQSFYVILNLAVGGNFDGDPQSDTIFPATMLVDYVRVFEKK